MNNLQVVFVSLCFLLCFTRCISLSPVTVETPVDKSARFVEDIRVSLEVNKLTKIEVQPGAKVMLVGDSLAAGMERQFFKLAKASAYEPVAHTVVGSNVLQWSSWIKKDVATYAPRLVVISLGTNDAMIIDRIRKVPNAYKDLQQYIEEHGAAVVWIGPPKFPKERVPHQPEIKQMIVEVARNYFDSETLFIERGSDKIHSTPTGYNGWMSSIWSWMHQKQIITTEKNTE